MRPWRVSPFDDETGSKLRAHTSEQESSSPHKLLRRLENGRVTLIAGDDAVELL